MENFIREAVKYIPKVTATVVAKPEVNLKKCKELAESLGAHFRVRQYQDRG